MNEGDFCQSLEMVVNTFRFFVLNLWEGGIMDVVGG